MQGICQCHSHSILCDGSTDSGNIDEVIFLRHMKPGDRSVIIKAVRNGSGACVNTLGM